MSDWCQFGLAVLAFGLLGANHWLTRRAHGLRERR